MGSYNSTTAPQYDPIHFSYIVIPYLPALPSLQSYNCLPLPLLIYICRPAQFPDNKGHVEIKEVIRASQGDSCRNGNTRDAGTLKIYYCNVYNFGGISKKIL